MLFQGHLQAWWIVERNSQTMKAIAERGETLPTKVVSSYNMSSQSRQKEETVWQKAIFKFTWRHPRVVPVTIHETHICIHQGWGKSMGKATWHTWWTTQWGRRTITRVKGHWITYRWMGYPTFPGFEISYSLVRRGGILWTAGVWALSWTSMEITRQLTALLGSCLHNGEMI